jgi:hypothetical protein
MQIALVRVSQLKPDKKPAEPILLPITTQRMKRIKIPLALVTIFSDDLDSLPIAKQFPKLSENPQSEQIAIQSENLLFLSDLLHDL